MENDWDVIFTHLSIRFPSNPLDAFFNSSPRHASCAAGCPVDPNPEKCEDPWRQPTGSPPSHAQQLAPPILPIYLPYPLMMGRT